jgi:hypothetical protein
VPCRDEEIEQRWSDSTVVRTIQQRQADVVATQLPFGMGRDALLLPILVAQGKEGLEVALHRALEWRLGRAPSAIGGGCASLRLDRHVRIRDRVAQAARPDTQVVAPAGALAPKIGGIVLSARRCTPNSEPILQQMRLSVYPDSVDPQCCSALLIERRYAVIACLRLLLAVK